MVDPRGIRTLSHTTLRPVESAQPMMAERQRQDKEKRPVPNGLSQSRPSITSLLSPRPCLLRASHLMEAPWLPHQALWGTTVVGFRSSHPIGFLAVLTLPGMVVSIPEEVCGEAEGEVFLLHF